MIINLVDRIKYYIGNENFENDPPYHDGIIRNNQPFIYKDETNFLYEEDVKRLSSLSKHKLWFQCGDKRYTIPNIHPVITKTIDTHDVNSHGIIGSLEYSRHFSSCNLAMKNKIRWEDKAPQVIWRGATTGINKDKRKCSRLDFVKMYRNVYDVGFNFFAGAWSKENMDICRMYYMPTLSIEEILKYKYIPILDGNDKASCLNWILASNSLPIMPKPRFHSWLCEKFLVPNVHYIELKDDYSDLPQKIEWCKKNDKKCKEIAENGKMFIKNNFHPIMERVVEKLFINEVDSIYDRIHK